MVCTGTDTEPEARERSPIPQPSPASARQRRSGPPPGFPLASPRAGKDRGLSGLGGRALASLPPPEDGGGGRPGALPRERMGPAGACSLSLREPAKDRLTRTRRPFVRNPFPLRPQGSRLGVCYYHRDRLRRPLHPPSRRGFPATSVLPYAARLRTPARRSGEPARPRDFHCVGPKRQHHLLKADPKAD
jgi:hypothetical protein